jgi:hypothetical protein
MQLSQKLSNPPAENRSLPFWSWNDVLDPKELRRQIQEMAKAKVGGFFMHARSGLKTTYLDKPWFEAIAVCLEEGRKAGLIPWAYDEEGWPSGFAGGKVTALGDAYHARGLRMQTVQTKEELQDAENVLGLYAHTQDFTHVYPLNKVPSDAVVTGYIAMTHSVSPYYIDILNPITTKAFIEATHEAYYERFEDQMPEGFFTDEPRLSEGPIPWSYIMQDEFENDHGYELLDVLPALYLPCEGYEAVRTDFWSTVSRLFVHSYMKQLYVWCEQHNIKLTGHMMMEEGLYSQMTGTSGSMPFYPFFHMPGIDSLRRMIHDPRMPKQVSSVAEQLGKKRVITESFALSGWDLNFEEMRWILNWQFVNGVNIFCQHLQAYSLKGFRKRDYPPSLFTQQSWWDEYHHFNDYMARLSTLLIEGKKIVEVLVLHPMHTGWITYDGTNNPVIQHYDAAFSDATKTLSGLHIDYHLGDETILKEHAKVENNALQVGSYSYQTVVLPELLSIDEHTALLLISFSKAGGKLYSIGSGPSLIEGRHNQVLLDELHQVITKLPDDRAILNEIKNRLAHPIKLLVEGKEEKRLSYCLHDHGQCLSLYIVNNSKTERVECTTIDLGRSYRVNLLDLETNTQVKIADSVQHLLTSFEAMEGRVYLIEESESIETIASNKNNDDALILTPDPLWDIERMDENILTLDTCRYRIDTGEWQEKKAVIRIMKELLTLKRSCSIELEFSFTLQDRDSIPGELYLVMEESKHFNITVNGIALKKPTGWYKDRAFEKLVITDAVAEGENTITIEGTFFQSQHVYDTLFGKNMYETELNKLTYDMELESIYILGNFGVYSKGPFQKGEREALETDGPFVITTQPRQLSHQSFTEQGLLFFAGRLTLSQKLHIPSQNTQAVRLSLGNPRLQMAKLYINDVLVKTFLWAPWEIDITHYVHEGENTITMTLYASNRNMLGPHHHISGENYSVGPQSFEGVFSWCERPSEAVAIDRSLVDKSYWKDSYTFVRFGF